MPARDESSRSNPDPPDLFKVHDHVFDRNAKLGYENLLPQEKAFVCVWELEAEVNNGGFNQYYFNSDHVLDAEESFRAIRANHTADLIKQANSILADAGPASNRNARQEQLLALDEVRAEKMNEFDEEFLAYKENLRELLEAYVVEHTEAFPVK